MKNFLRALRFCWPYRYRLGLSILCALLAAVFWGLNFTAIYPVLEILGSDKNLQEWVDEHIADSEKQIKTLTVKQEDLNAEAAEIAKKPDGKEKDKEMTRVARDLAKVTGQLADASRDSSSYRLYKVLIEKLFPNDRFETLMWVVLLVVIAVAIKGVFEFAQESLVGSAVNLSLYDMRNRIYRRVLHLDMQGFGDQGSS